MSHECEACGASFDTLSGLRLHSCPELSLETDFGTDWADQRREKRTRERSRRAQRATSDELDASLEKAQSGDAGSAVTALAHLERELERAIDSDDDEIYRDIYWTYYEPTAQALDTVARAEGWSFLLEIASAYDPRDDGEMPVVGDPITNVIARGLIRTRLNEGIETVPTAALEYLAAIPRIDLGRADIAWEESMQYGWAIGHPDHSIKETILEHVPIDEIWASGAAIRALYADQHSAVGLYTAVIEAMAWEDRWLAVDQLDRFEGDPGGNCSRSTGYRGRIRS